MNPSSSVSLRRWLLLCCAMIFIMAIIGAITRLTESGLSITEWAPVTGALPPLNEAGWQDAFAAYQRIPQYQTLNQGMNLEEFKQIYFWEWLHRLWGRLIGLVYALPFFWFLWHRQVPRDLRSKLWLGLALGFAQGALGWYMVQSGLSKLVYVSPYRLAAHLALALIIYSYLLWLALDLSDKKYGTNKTYRHGYVVLACVTATIVWGAFVAGHKAGWAYNTFPLMNGALLPPEAWNLQPLWHNFFANTAMVQFCHRWLAIGTAALILAWAWRLMRAWQPRHLVWLLGCMVVLQVTLGVSTLLLGVPVWLGALHQAGAILLLTSVILNLHALLPPQKRRSI